MMDFAKLFWWCSCKLAKLSLCENFGSVMKFSALSIIPDIMSRNVRFTVGAILRRSVVDLSALPRPLPPKLCNASLVRRAYSSRAPLPTPRILSPLSSSRISTSTHSHIEASFANVFQRLPTRPPPRQGSVTTSTVLAWRRSVHCKACKAKRKKNAGDRRNKSSVSNGPARQNQPSISAPQAKLSPNPPAKPPKSPSQPSAASNKLLLERIPQSLPHFHRPTKAELLAAATGFWSRLKVHFKWLTIKSVRPFNMDEISAFFSWILVGHVIWIIVGTTTFFSLTIFLINTVFAQGTIYGKHVHCPVLM